MDLEQLLQISKPQIISTLGWTLYYQFWRRIFSTQYLKSKENVWPGVRKIKILSEFHARILSWTVSTCIAFGYLYHDYFIVWKGDFSISAFEKSKQNLGQEAAWNHHLLINFLLGYLTHDTIWCCRSGWHDTMNYFHHISSIVLFNYLLHFTNDIYPVCMGIAIFETSTVVLNLAWFARYTGHWLGKPLKKLFSLVFLTVRVVWGSYYVFQLYKSGMMFEYSKIYQGMMVFNCLLSYGFMKQIFDSFRR